MSAVATRGRRVLAAAAGGLLVLSLVGCGGSSDDPNAKWSEEQCVEHVQKKLSDTASAGAEGYGERLQQLQQELVAHGCPQTADGTSPPDAG